MEGAQRTSRDIHTPPAHPPRPQSHPSWKKDATIHPLDLATASKHGFCLIFVYRIMYQSIPSLTIPGRPLGIRTFLLPLGWSGFRPTFLPGGRGFESENFPTVLKENCRNFSICFKKPGTYSLKSKCSCAV